MNPGPARPMPHPLRNLNHHFGPFVNWVSPIHPPSRYKIHRFHLSPCLQLAKDKGKSLIVNILGRNGKYSKSNNPITGIFCETFLQWKWQQDPFSNSNYQFWYTYPNSSRHLFSYPISLSIPPSFIHQLKTKMPDIKG